MEEIALKLTRMITYSQVLNLRAKSVFTALSLAVVSSIPVFAANTDTWNNTGGTDFNTSTNWNPTHVPGSQASNDIAAFTGTSVANPNLSASVSIGTITFAAGTSGYDITSSNSGLSIQLNSSSGISATNTTGTNTISSNLILAYSAGAQGISQNLGGELVLSGTISSTGTFVSLILGSVGTSTTTEFAPNITITGTNNSYTGGTVIGSSVGSAVVAVTKLGSAGGNGSLGTGTIYIGQMGNSTAYAGLDYIGAGETSNKVIVLQEVANSVIRGIDTTGETGALVLTAGISGTSTATGTSSDNITLELNGTSTFGDTESGVISDTADSGGSTGTFHLAVLKYGTGSWTLSGANTYTGATTVSQGNLILDLSNNNNVINSGNAFSLGATNQATSDTLTIKGAAGTNSSQTLGNETNLAGSSHIVLTPGASGGTVTLNMGTLGGLAVGQALDITTGSGITVTTTTASSATTGMFQALVTVNGNDFATNNGNAANSIVGLSTISGGYLTASSYTANQSKPIDILGNTAITASGTTTVGVASIRFNQNAAYTLTITGTAGVGSNSSAGAILVTSNVGANTTLITGGSLGVPASTGADKGLDLVQNNTQGILEIDSNINNSNGAQDISKFGLGTALLTGTNVNTGVTDINEGMLQFKNEVSLYDNNSTSWTAANINVANGATLGLNVGGAGEFTSTDVATISALGTATSGLQNGSTLALDTTDAGGNFTYNTGIANTNSGANSIGLAKLGTGDLTLGGASTYTGSTTVFTGGLIVNGSLAGTSGVTVKSGATIGGSGSIHTTGNNLISGNVQVGAGGTDTSTQFTLATSGTTTFSGANLSFNIDTAGNGNSMSVESTHDVLFSGATLTLNVQGSSPISNGTEYVLFTGTTLDGGGLGIGGTTSGFGGDLAFTNDPSQLAGALSGYTLDFTGTLTDYSYSYLILTANGLGTGYNIDLVVEAQSVPEPGTWALMLGGLALLVVYQRSRRSRKA